MRFIEFLFYGIGADIATLRGGKGILALDKRQKTGLYFERSKTQGKGRKVKIFPGSVCSVFFSLSCEPAAFGGRGW
jgi:hypothetical protein